MSDLPQVLDENGSGNAVPKMRAAKLRRGDDGRAVAAVPAGDVAPRVELELYEPRSLDALDVYCRFIDKQIIDLTNHICDSLKARDIILEDCANKIDKLDERTTTDKDNLYAHFGAKLKTLEERIAKLEGAKTIDPKQLHAPENDFQRLSDRVKALEADADRSKVLQLAQPRPLVFPKSLVPVAEMIAARSTTPTSSGKSTQAKKSE